MSRNLEILDKEFKEIKEIKELKETKESKGSDVVVKEQTIKRVQFLYSDYGYLEVNTDEYNDDNTMIAVKNSKLNIYGTINVSALLN